MIVFVNDENRKLYEQFVMYHKNGGFTQSLLWPSVKKSWKWEAFMCQNEKGEIKGAQLVLIKKLPLGYSFLYSPRGPVYDFEDDDTRRELFEAVKELAKKHKAYKYTMDPEIPAAQSDVVDRILADGFTLCKGGKSGLECIQARFNYKLNIADKTADELFMSFHSKTRYNIRVALKHGVEVKVGTADDLGDFYELMKKTGERDGFTIRPKSYFAGMLGGLGSHARLYMCYYDGKPVSGAVCTVYGKKACYVYGASDNAHRNVMPNYLMQWEMIQYAKSEGCEIYDFQGVSGNIDESDPQYGLYRFKKGFNGELCEYAGEFDFVFKPAVNKTVDLAQNARKLLNKIKNQGGH